MDNAMETCQQSGLIKYGVAEVPATVLKALPAFELSLTDVAVM